MADDTTQQTENSELATVTRRIPVVDNSQFSGYLDTARFDQISRVGLMLSRSMLVPDHFKGKPADCFIIAQMAMRLGLDPLMLLQKTYVIGGKPGVEAQIVIALINSSGLFKSSIRYEITGEGDDRGCVAWAPDKDGNRLDGPRVSVATAKAEGWMGRNGSKWRTIPDLMMMYRSGTWFGRLYCPERLMGMQTVDELIDIGEEQPKPTAPQLGTDAVKEKIRRGRPPGSTNRPKDDSSDSAASEATNGTDGGGNPPDAASGPENGGGDQQGVAKDAEQAGGSSATTNPSPAAEPWLDDELRFAGFRDSLVHRVEELNGLTPEQGKGIATHIDAYGKILKGTKPDNITSEQRRLIASKILAGQKLY